MKHNRNIIVKDDPDLLAYEAAGLFTETAIKRVFEQNIFTVAVSGGTTPRLMHNLLAEEPYLSKVPWDKTHFFWVDERCVSHQDPHSNYGAFKKDLINKIKIPESNIHPMPGESFAETGPDLYENQLMRFFHLEEGQVPRFDLIILGIGQDGHTASLFPGHKALDEEKKLVFSVKGGDPNVYRLTMTFPVLNNARAVWFLASGNRKATVVKTVFENKKPLFPAARVQPINGTLTWLVDREAALGLE